MSKRAISSSLCSADILLSSTGGKLPQVVWLEVRCAWRHHAVESTTLDTPLVAPGLPVCRQNHAGRSRSAIQASQPINMDTTKSGT